MESIIIQLATCEISNFKLVSVTEETGLSLALLETQKTGFVATRPIYEAWLNFRGHDKPVPWLVKVSGKTSGEAGQVASL